MNYDYLEFYIFRISIFYIPIMFIVLNYLLYRFKNKRINLFSLYSLNFLILGILFANTDIPYFLLPNFITNIIDGGDGGGVEVIGFALTLLIDLILTTTYFKEDKKKYKISFIITLILIILFLNLFCISIYYLINNSKRAPCDSIFENYVCGSAGIFIFSFFPIGIIKLFIQTIFAIFLIYKLLEKAFICFKDKIYDN